MKRLLCVLAGMTLLGLGLALAQAVHSPLQFSMDSPFYVGDKLLPAGPYLILSTGENGLLEIRNSAKGFGAFVMTFEKDSSEHSASSQVIFDKCGDELFLNSVVVEPAGEAVTALPSRAEKRAMESGPAARVVIPAVPAQRKG